MAKNRIILLLLCFGLILACSRKSLKPAATNNLPKEYFSINTNRDTVIVTKEGAIIEIPANSLKCKTGNIAKIRIRQAFNISDMINGHLITKTGNEPLSSGGMIEILPELDGDVTITKKISISIPTKFRKKGMKLFKGNYRPDSTLDWIAPTNLDNADTALGLTGGAAVFQRNCASCHFMDKDATGPALAHIPQNRDPMWMGLFIADWPALLHHDRYTRCLNEQWGKIPHPVFPNLSHDEYDSLFQFINDSSSFIDPSTVRDYKKSYDSCRVYDSIKKVRSERLTQLNKAKEAFEAKVRQFVSKNFEDSIRKINLITENGKAVVYQNKVDPNLLSINNRQNTLVNNTTPTPPANAQANFEENRKAQVNNTTPTPPANARANIEEYRKASEEYKRPDCVYYQFKIETFGWYNIDIITKGLPGFEDRELFVRIIDQYKTTATIYLALPNEKILLEGIKSADSDVYFFYTKNGQIPLPLNAKAYVLGMGESEGKVLFGISEFTIAPRQNISVELSIKTYEETQITITKLDIKGLNFGLGESKNATEIKAIDSLRKRNADSLNTITKVVEAYTDSIKAATENLQQAEDYQPKNCDCNCGSEDVSDYEIMVEQDSTTRINVLSKKLTPLGKGPYKMLVSQTDVTKIKIINANEKLKKP